MNKNEHPLYSRWKSIMERCYKENRRSYKFYGGKGITVDDRWHDFWNFVYDIDNRLHNGHLLYQAGWHLDKDINGGKSYSLENCMVVSAEHNRSLATEKLKREIYALKDNHATKFESVSEAARQLNITRSNIKYFLKSGKTDKNSGYKFIYCN